ncbi:MAG: VCBS repeat-containing protein [Thermoanaerobaculia bacterium]|nr:VCBS repeat-containing protein [Thermoanaerobaculia bacterium]
MNLAWGIVLLATPLVALDVTEGENAAAPTGAAHLNLSWVWAPLGANIGAAGLHVVDLAGQGIPEIVTSSSTHWYALAWDGTDYVPTWSTLRYSEGITALEVAQIDQDAALEVIVAAGETVYIYDGATKQLEIDFPIGVVPARMVVGDIDADGTAEVVVIDEHDLYSYSATTGASELVRFGFGGFDLDLGQIDDDAALEIGVADFGQTTYVLDGTTGIPDYQRNGLGGYLDFANLNNDGYDDLVVSWGNLVEAFDVVADQLLWDFSPGALRAIAPIDVQGNPQPEMVLSDDGGLGSVKILNQAGVELGAVDNPSGGANAIASGDTDLDELLELVWGSQDSDYVGHLYVASANKNHIEWQSFHIEGPFYGLDQGDVDNDGSDEYLLTVSNSDIGATYLIFDVATKKLETVGQPLDFLYAMFAGQLIDIDSDPQLEICVAMDNFSSGLIVCYDGLGHTEEWRFTLPSHLGAWSLLAADVDGDGDQELVAGTYARNSGSPGSYVYVLEPSTGQVVWTSPELSGTPGTIEYLSKLEVGQVDLDPEPEVVVASDSYVAVLDGPTGAIELPSTQASVHSLNLSDIDGMGTEEILVGTFDGFIKTIDSTTGNSSVVSGPFGGPIDAIDRATFAGLNRYVVVVDGVLGVYSSLTAAPDSLLDLGPEAGAYNTLFISNVSGDSRILVNTMTGVAEIEVGSNILFADGFESGNTSAWSFPP